MASQDTDNEKKPLIKEVIEGANSLSLGISMVVAVAIGTGLGLYLKSLFDAPWLLWVGVFWGVAAAVLNVYKTYKKQVRDYDELAKDPKYSRVNNPKS